MADVAPVPDSGAAGTELQTIAAMRRQGCQVVEVWAHDLPNRLKHGNLHYLLELPYGYRKVLKEHLGKIDFDVVHTNQPHGYLAAKYARENCPRTVFVHRSHGFELRAKREVEKWKRVMGEKDRRPVSRAMASWILSHLLDHNSRSIARWADGHIVSASECRDHLIEELHVLPERVVVIPQAAPDRFLSVPNVCIADERLKKILYVGQFAFIKAPMIVAAVFNQLARARGDLEFTWVCSKQHHEAARALLHEDVRLRVRFLPWLSQDELLNVYDRHGIFLFPSFFEGFGKAFMEALARGLCVVAADNGGMKDVIEHGVNGLKCQTGDVNSFTAACLNLLESPAEARMMSDNAIRSSKAYTWSRVATETLGFYQYLLQSRK